MTDAFKDSIANAFPANGPKAPPALPRKAPPPLPPKRKPDPATADLQEGAAAADPVASLANVQPAADAADRLRAIAASLPAYNADTTPPAIEKGYVNPPDSPAVLAATPEEAAVVQGIEAPKAPVADELETLTKAQLVELANSIGAEFAKGARETGIRKAIRAKRAELAFNGDGLEAVKALADSMPLTDLPAELKEPPTVSPERKEARLRLLAEADPTPTGLLNAVRKELLEGNSEHLYLGVEQAIERTATSDKVWESVEAVQRAEKEETVSAPIGMLLVNCDAIGNGGRVLTQAEMVRKGNELIRSQSGIEDYRLVDYGKGAGYLALAVKSAIEDGSFGDFAAAAIDTRTPEGQTLFSTLAALSGFVIRGT